MIPSHDITGVVLAGGHSTRFGCNKAMALWNEESLLRRALSLLQSLCGEVLIGGDYPEYDTFRNRRLPDLIPGLGPLGGILTALEYTDTPFLLFLTCDMPLLKASLLERLLQSEPPCEVTVWEQTDGTLQMFPLLISRDLYPLVKWKVQQNTLSIRSLLLESTSEFILVRQDEERHFLNVNRKEDLDELLKYE